jgi:hypothetical protein
LGQPCAEGRVGGRDLASRVLGPNEDHWPEEFLDLISARREIEPRYAVSETAVPWADLTAGSIHCIDETHELQIRSRLNWVRHRTHARKRPESAESSGTLDSVLSHTIPEHVMIRRFEPGIQRDWVMS